MPDYMENFSQGSERNPPEMKVAITWRRFQPGLKNTQKVHEFEMKFQPGLNKEREHEHRLCFRTPQANSYANLRFAPGLTLAMPNWALNLTLAWLDADVINLE